MVMVNQVMSVKIINKCNSLGNGKFHILFLFFVSAMFSISLCSLLGYHIHLVLNNRTTLEEFRAPVFRRGPDKEGFSLGKRGNLTEVFGDTWWRMFLPVFSSFGDGLTFPQRFSEDPELGQQQRQDSGTVVALVEQHSVKA